MSKKHRNKININKNKSLKKALRKNLILSLFKHKKIITTNSNVKKIKGKIDKLINLFKKNTLYGKRRISSFLGKKSYLKLVEDVANKSSSINCGYIKIIKYKNRRGDNAKISLLMFTFS